MNIFPLTNKGRLFIFILFLTLVLAETYIVLYIEQKMASHKPLN